MRAGCHVSTRGGYTQAAKTAAALGAKSFQYFPKNPRSLVVKSFDESDAKRCAAFCQERGMVSIAHSPYPTNIASEDSEHRARTVLSLLNDLAIAEACGSIGVVVHFGVYKGSQPLEGYQNVIFSLNAITTHWSGQAKLLIENQAGEHTFMGTTMEELAQIRSLADHPQQIGFCLDTCHLFASGVWDGNADAAWLGTAAEQHVLDHIEAIHLNDSVFPSGARRDRHAILGEGYIGEAGLKWLLNLRELAALPVILETPAGLDGTHLQQLELIREWGGSV